VVAHAAARIRSELSSGENTAWSTL
jgi:hypothetical protein